MDLLGKSYFKSLLNTLETKATYDNIVGMCKYLKEELHCEINLFL